MSQTIQLGPREIDALARIAVAEAEIDGTRGMQAVVATILNRAAANKGYFGGTDIIDIINKPGQFRPVTPVGHVERLPQAPESVERMVAEFASAFSRQSDPTNGATFFRNAAQTRGNAQDRNSNITARIGGHTFYGSYGTGARVELPDEVSVSLAEPVAQRYGIATTPTPPDMPRDFSVFQGARTSVRGNFQRGTPLSDYVEKGTATPFQGVVAHTVGVANARPGSLARNMRENLQGYSFVVDKDGSVYQTASLSDRTNHVKDITSRTLTRPDLSNANAIGIAFNVKTPDEITPAMEQAARGLVMDLADRGVIPSAGEVYAHTELQEEKNPEEGLSFARSMRSEFGVPDPVPVSEERFAEVMAQRRADIDGAVSPTRTAQVPTPPERSLLDSMPIAGRSTAETVELARANAPTPPARPADLAARPDIGNRTLAGYNNSFATIRAKDASVDLENIAPEMSRVIDAVRGVAPNAEIVVTDAYRSPQRHDDLARRGLNPSPTSLHLDGLALDIRGKGMDPETQREVVRAARFAGANEFGFYDPAGLGHIHIGHNPASQSVDVYENANPNLRDIAGSLRRGEDIGAPSFFTQPPSRNQAVAARARNPANVTAFVEPPDPQPVRVAAAPTPTMTDVSQTLPAQTPTRPAARQGMISGQRAGFGSFAATPRGFSGRSSAPMNLDLVRDSVSRPDPQAFGFFSDFTRLANPAAAPLSVARAPAMSFAPNMPEAFAPRATPGSPSFVPGAARRSFAPAPTVIDRSPAEIARFRGVAREPVTQSVVRNPMGARSPRAMGAEAIVQTPAPSAFRSVPVSRVNAPVPGVLGTSPVPAEFPFSTPPLSARAPAPAPAPVPALDPTLGNYAEAPPSAMQRSTGLRGAGEFIRDLATQPKSYVNEYWGDYFNDDVFAPVYDPSTPQGFFGMSRQAYEQGFYGPTGKPYGAAARSDFDVDRDLGLGAAFRDQFGGLGTLGGFDLRDAMIGGGIGLLTGGPVGALTGAIGGGFGIGRRAREAAVDAAGNIFDGFGEFLGNVFGGSASASASSATQADASGVSSSQGSGNAAMDYTESRDQTIGDGQ